MGLRVLMLSWEFPPRVIGGLARHVFDLSRALSRRGHDVVVLTANHAGAAAEEVVDGVRVQRLGTFHPQPMDFVGWVMHLNLTMVEAALGMGPGGRPVHLVHAHDWLTAYAGKVLKHGWRVPLVATVHATEHGRHNGIHTDLQRYINDVEWWLTYEAWRVICCSTFMCEEIQRIFQAPADKIRVIPNGVDPVQLAAAGGDLAAFRQRFAGPEERIVFFIGRVVPEKGVPVLMEAIPLILARYPSVRFVIAGDGPALNACRERTRTLGVQDRVQFLGFVDGPVRSQLFRIADVAVFPSLYEPFGIVALEAMATGTPVVVGDTGGFSEVVRHGHNGLKADPGNVPSLVENVIALLLAPGLGDKLRRNALAEVKARYDWDVIAQATERVYREVVAEGCRTEASTGKSAAAYTR